MAGVLMCAPATAKADSGQAASPSTTVVTKTVDVTTKVPVTSLATQTSQVTVTSVKKVDDTNDDDDSDKTGLWGLLGLLGLAGLVGLKRRNDAPATGGRVPGDTTPRGSTAR